MKFFFQCRLWLILMGTIVSARVGGLADYAWTNAIAFPGVSPILPVAIATPPGETNRLFIVQQGGTILVISNLAAPNTNLFLNLYPRVRDGVESGLLGMAFHPGYATNGFFYIFYTYKTNSAFPQLYWDVLSRFQVSALDPNKADASSELALFIQADRGENHNGGDLHFGPDGYLYVSVGDEGGENNQYGAAQQIASNLFSGILRIDVDKRPGSLPPNPSPTFATTTNYAIPPDNPFVGATNFDGLTVDPNQVRTEFWAVGFRNPWRFSFDPATAQLYCGDVGQDTYEEVDIIAKGGNGGWPYYEGSLHNGPDVPNLIVPSVSYVHGTGLTNGDCVIGGLVYRGGRYPQLDGAYIFGDYMNQQVWGVFCDGTNSTPPVILTFDKIRGFGTDPRNGDVLFFDASNLRRLTSLTPVINSISCVESNVIIRGAGGKTGRFVDLLASSDLSVPLTSWTIPAITTVDAAGNFAFTNVIDPANWQKFYQIK